MSTRSIPENLDPEVVHARKRPVHVELAADDEGERHLAGWVSCPARGPLDLERCTACMHCRGVMLEPRGGAPEVLCGWPGARDGAGLDQDAVGAWLSRPALAVTGEVPAAELGRLMLEYGVDALVVVDADSAPRGLVRQRDVLACVLGGDGKRSALQVMQPLGELASEHMAMADVTARMAEGVGVTVPVANEKGHVFAMLTPGDAVRWATRGASPA